MLPVFKINPKINRKRHTGPLNQAYYRYVESSCYEEEIVELTDHDFSVLDLHKQSFSYQGTNLLTLELLTTVYSFLESNGAHAMKKRETMQAIQDCLLISEKTSLGHLVLFNNLS